MLRAAAVAWRTLAQRWPRACRIDIAYGPGEMVRTYLKIE
jgi:hypothetical protein